MIGMAGYIFTVAFIGWPKVDRRAQDYVMTMTLQNGEQVGVMVRESK